MKRLFKKITLVIAFFSIGKLYAAAAPLALLPAEIAIPQVGGLPITVLTEETLNNLEHKARFLEAQVGEAREAHLPTSSSMPHVALRIIDGGVAKEKEKGKTLENIVGTHPLLHALVETGSVLRDNPGDKDVLKNFLINLAFAAGEFACEASLNSHLSYTQFDALPAEDPRFDELSHALLSAFDLLFSEGSADQ